MERAFTITYEGLTIPCYLAEPDFGEIRRVVLGVHGLTGSAMDAIQTGLAEEMEMFYAASLRFDFPCHGENPCEVLTLENCQNTLLAAAQYARQRYPQVEDMCIFASGFGAYVVLSVLPDLAEMPGRVKLVVHTPSVRMHETLLAMRGITPPTLQAMERIPFALTRPFDVTYRFYQELKATDVLRRQPLPMLILHSEENDFIRMNDILQFRRMNPASKLVIITGTSHRFLEAGAWDMVLDLTRDWFEFEQVLCCDWE